MIKIFTKTLVAGFVSFIAYAGYDYFQAGLDTRPEMPSDAFSLSFKNGLRGIVVDVLDERRSRRYIGRPFEVPFFLKDAWSYCYPPTLQQQEFFEQMRPNAFERFDAFCEVTIDGEKVARGVITTVPKL